MAKISDALAGGFNKQIIEETRSALEYFNQASYYRLIGLEGLGHRMKREAESEYEDADRLFHFVTRRNGRAAYGAIPATATDYASPLAALTAWYTNEVAVTKLLQALLEKAQLEDDDQAVVLLQKFVKHQTKGEREAWELMQQMTLVGNDKAGWLQVDEDA